MKPWYRSKTIWVNLLMLVLSIIVAVQDSSTMPIEELAAAAAVINVVLRFVTADPIGWFEEK